MKTLTLADITKVTIDYYARSPELAGRCLTAAAQIDDDGECFRTWVKELTDRGLDVGEIARAELMRPSPLYDAIHRKTR
jgi:hypothetical protein